MDECKPLATGPEVITPTQLPTNKWRSHKDYTLGPQYLSAIASSAHPANPWVDVPEVRITAVHGLDDEHPAMASALQHLAALQT